MISKWCSGIKITRTAHDEHMATIPSKTQTKTKTSFQSEKVTPITIPIGSLTNPHHVMVVLQWSLDLLWIPLKLNMCKYYYEPSHEGTSARTSLKVGNSLLMFSWCDDAVDPKYVNSSLVNRFKKSELQFGPAQMDSQRMNPSSPWFHPHTCSRPRPVPFQSIILFSPPSRKNKGLNSIQLFFSSSWVWGVPRHSLKRGTIAEGFV